MSEPVILRDKTIIGENHEVAFYKPEGETNKPIILMLHGMWATRARFDPWARYFSARGFPCVVPTYRHHYPGNENNIALGKTSICDYANDTIGLIGSLKLMLKQVILMGHSMGGPIAQLVASRITLTLLNPLSALITLGSAPVAGVSLYSDKDYKHRIARVASKILTGKPYLPDFDSMSKYVYNGMPMGEHQALYKGAVYESGTAAREILAGSGEGLPRTIARLYTNPIDINEMTINCPMLNVGGSIDRITPPAIAHDLQKKYQRWAKPCDLKIFPNVAHWVQFEPGWEERAEYVLQWIKANVPDVKN